jgi:hypothetical protein
MKIEDITKVMYITKVGDIQKLQYLYMYFSIVVKYIHDKNVQIK